MFCVVIRFARGAQPVSDSPHRSLKSYLFLFLDAQRIDDAGDPLAVLVDEFLKVVAAQEDRRPAELFQGAFPRRRFSGGFDELHQRIALRRGNAGRAEDAAPVGQFDVDALLFECRNTVYA